MTAAKQLLQQQLTHHQNHTNTRINQQSAEHDKAVTILKQQFDTQDIVRASSLRTAQDELPDARRQISRLEAELAIFHTQVPSQSCFSMNLLPVVLVRTPTVLTLSCVVCHRPIGYLY